MVAGVIIRGTAGAVTISPPSVQYLDKFGVNMLNGQVNTSLNTVSIGGEMGLSHSISMYTNHFQRAGQRGYVDKYSGSAQFSQLLGPNQIWPVMRVFDSGGSADFWIKTGASYYNGTGNESGANVSYVAIKDERNKLVVAGSSSEFLDWTKPDGTLTRFRRAPNPHCLRARKRASNYLSEWLHHLPRLSEEMVWTNTGFSWSAFTSPMRGRPMRQPMRTLPRARSYSVAEALNNPRYIKAVNNASCSVTIASCIQRVWPTAVFTWPRGMPRTMYIGNRTFSVDTPAGTTTYEYQPYDLAKNGDVVVQGYQLGQRLSPRLYKIKPASTTAAALTYTYKNLWVYSSVGLRDDLFGVEYVPPTGTFPSGMGEWANLVQDAGVILTAKLIDQNNSYEMGQAYAGPGAAQNVGLSVGNLSQVIINVGATPSYTTSLTSLDGMFSFEASSRNFVTQIRRPTGPIDNPSRIRRGQRRQSIKTNGTIMSRAVYANEESCATRARSAIRRSSIYDAKGNETRYEYHADSGMVSRISSARRPEWKSRGNSI